MAIQQSDTALLLFSRRSEEESLAKNFFPFASAAKNKALTQKIIDRSIVLAKNSGLPFFVWDEKLQHGNCFGEKLANAIAGVFEKGFEKIIVIGNDCLTLRSTHIHRATVALQSHKYVLAPTKKGGTYLIGLTQNNFNYKAFTSLRWQSSFVYKDLQGLFLSPVFELPMQDDVNNFNDLRKQVSLLIKADALQMYVVSIIASLYNAYQKRLSFFLLNLLVGFAGLRGPPLVR